MARDPIERMVGWHDGCRLRFLDTCLKGGQVDLSEFALRQLHGGSVQPSFRLPVRYQMLQRSYDVISI